MVHIYYFSDVTALMTIDLDEWSGMDLSGLINLEHLIFDCPEGHFVRETMECMCVILGQVNTTRLEQAAPVLYSSSAGLRRALSTPSEAAFCSNRQCRYDY